MSCHMIILEHGHLWRGPKLFEASENKNKNKNKVTSIWGKFTFLGNWPINCKRKVGPAGSSGKGLGVVSLEKQRLEFEAAKVAEGPKSQTGGNSIAYNSAFSLPLKYMSTPSCTCERWEQQQRFHQSYSPKESEARLQGSPRLMDSGKYLSNWVENLGILSRSKGKADIDQSWSEHISSVCQKN